MPNVKKFGVILDLRYTFGTPTGVGIGILSVYLGIPFDYPYVKKWPFYVN